MRCLLEFGNTTPFALSTEKEAVVYPSNETNLFRKSKENEISIEDEGSEFVQNISNS
jgi:hypothetical protein